MGWRGDDDIGERIRSGAWLMSIDQHATATVVFQDVVQRAEDEFDHERRAEAMGWFAIGYWRLLASRGDSDVSWCPDWIEEAVAPVLGSLVGARTLMIGAWILSAAGTVHDARAEALLERARLIIGSRANAPIEFRAAYNLAKQLGGVKKGEGHGV